jgi:ligand-binding sensor domain-containing protein
VWAGTNGGVSRFDGQSWQAFLPRDGLAGFSVRHILEAADGAVWVATESGVSRFDGQIWQSFTTADGLADSDVYLLTKTATTAYGL